MDLRRLIFKHLPFYITLALKKSIVNLVICKMSSSIALLTRNNFIAAMLTFHSEVDGVKSVLTTEENILKAFTIFLDDKELLITPNFNLKDLEHYPSTLYYTAKY